jgi:transcription elongation factor GreA
MAYTKTQLTHQGFDQLQARIERLRAKIKEHEVSMETTIQTFGVHDEQYYERQQRKVFREQELMRLEEILHNSILIDEEIHETSRVDIGDKVKLTNHRICYIFQIVSSIEANPLEGKISIDSPIGASIVGKGVGDQITITLPKGDIDLKIASIE